MFSSKFQVRDVVQVIAFRPTQSQPTSQPPTTPNTPTAELQGNEVPTEETLAWYYSLPSKNIECLQLRRGDADFVVVLIMQDGSQFQLELLQQSQLDQPSIIGKISRVSDISSLSSTRLISIEMVQAHSPPHSTPNLDMRFVLAFCRGAFRILHTSGQHIESLFALGLTASVARKCIPVHNDLANHSKTPIDDLWRSMSSPTEAVGESLWEEDIADERRNKVRDKVSDAARQCIEDWLFPSQDITRHRPAVLEASSDESQKRRTFATSIAAWLEFSASETEVTSLALWDKTWEETWDETWAKAWRENWNNIKSDLFRVASIKLGRFIEPDKLISINLTAMAKNKGRLSGQKAGRASTRVGLAEVTAKIPETSLLIKFTKNVLNNKGKNH